MTNMDEALYEKEQARMNEELWRLASSKIHKHGDINRVAAEIGVTRQTLTNIQNNKNYPSGSTIGQFKRVFPSLNTDAIFLGVEQADAVTPNPNPPTATPAQEGEWKRRYQELDAKYTALEAKFDVLLDKYSNVMDRVMAKMAFSGSDSHTTAPIGALAGFKRYDEPKAARKSVFTVHRNENPFLQRKAIQEMYA